MTLPSPRRLGLALMASSMLIAPGAAFAQSSQHNQSDEVDDVIVTATGVAVNTRDAPASVSVITREDIERQPVQNIGPCSMWTSR